MLSLICLFNFTFAELNNVKYENQLKKKDEDAAISLVREMILSKEVRDLIGINLDPITKITNVYQDYNDRRNIIYEYTINTNKETRLKEALYDKYAIFFWEQNLPNVCAMKEMKMAINLGVGVKYIYIDSNEKIIADMTIRKKDCDNLK